MESTAKIILNADDPMITISTKEGLTDRQVDIRAKKYLELDTAIKALEKEREAIKNELLEEGTRATAHYTVTVSHYSQGSFDSKAFKADYPDLAPLYTKTSERSRLSVKAI